MRRIIQRTVTTTTTTWQITWDDREPLAPDATTPKNIKEHHAAPDDGASSPEDRQNNKEINNATSVPSDVPADRVSD